MLAEAPLLSSNAQAAQLTAFVRGVADAVGVEQSVKVSKGGVEAERFLLSWARRGEEAQHLPRLFSDLSMPSETCDEIAAQLGQGAFYHFGYEGGAIQRFKFYCERNLASTALQSPLYTAWKWRPFASDPVGVDDYWMREAGSLEAAQDVILTAFAGRGGAIASELLALLEQCADRGDIPMFLDVHRRGGGRRSFDMRCYGLQLHLADINALISAADSEFGSNGGLVTALTQHRNAELGHIAGGLGSDDRPFVTFYFGAKALA